MKNIVFLAFANREDNYLTSLKEEEDRIYKMLALREKEGHFSVYRDGSTTQGKIIEYLNLHKEEIIGFHYSGHAGRDALFLADEPATAQGIASFLAQCPKLKWVLLNGCSTKGQVDRLVNLESAPVVIATSAPVGDKSATVFSIGFYQALCEQFQTIEEAYKAGLASAQVIGLPGITPTRDVFGRFDVEGDDPVWDISSKSSTGLEWRLPSIPAITDETTDFEPNAFLAAQLMEAFAPYSASVLKASQQSQLSDSRKRRVILEALPLPISEQLRKLFAVRDSRANSHIFYDQLGYDRLKQIINAYKTVAELLTFIHLAQLWNEASQHNLTITKEETAAIKDFFHLAPSERREYQLMNLIQIVNDIFEANKIPNFLDEFNPLSTRLGKDTQLGEAIALMHRITLQITALGSSTMPEQQAVPLCIEAEKKLAVILSSMAFLIRYEMTSIKSIGVFRFRHRAKPTYMHAIIRLIQHFFEIEPEQEERAEAMYTASVILSKENGESLNLTPFIIDQNAFDEKAPLAKICHFTIFEEAIDKYAFKHVYNPGDNFLEIKNQAHFAVIKEQFSDFIQTVLNR